MNSKTQQPLSDEEIQALLDGQVASSALAALELRLSHDPAAQATLLKWQQQRLALKQLYQGVVDEPAPSHLKNTVITAPTPEEKPPSTHWGGIAASVMLSFAIGWLSHSFWLAEDRSSAVSPQLVSAPANQRFALQARVAHTVYSSDVQHPVEVNASEKNHLLNWLSERLNKPIQVPKLTELGFELLGGRLVPGDSGARAQFMYQNVDGLRITLYMGDVDSVAGSAASREMPLTYWDDAAAPSFYWVEHAFGYALVGALPHDELQKVAQSVYHQL